MIRTAADAQGWDTNRGRDFQDDVLIGLTARRHGATVITANRRNFELLAKELGVYVVP